MKYDELKSLISEEQAIKYLNKGFENLIESFLNYLNGYDIEIYNEDSLKFELGTFLRIILPNYYVNFEKNVKCFIQDTETIKHEIDITIYPKVDNKDNINDNTIKLINSDNVYAIELKFPSFQIKKAKNNDTEFVKEYNKGTNDLLKNLVKDLIFIKELKDSGFKKTWSFVLVPKIAYSVYQFPKNKRDGISKLYNRFRGFDNEGNSIWNKKSNENKYKLKWNNWQDKKGNNIGKYYIKSGNEIKEIIDTINEDTENLK